MEAKEFRIKNNIYYKNEIINICGVTDSGIYFYDGKTHSSTKFLFFEDLKPIELTEEILLKCKNIKEETFHYAEGSIKGWCIEQDNSALDIVLFEDGFHLYKRTDDVYWGYIENEIKYLHDLQNVFYYTDNQKTELEINL